MAENSKGGILNKTEKFLRRRKTKVLQSLGKTGKTTDEQLQEDTQRLEKQQEIANKFQKDLRHYIHSARALALASKTFYTTLSETYEADWEGHTDIAEILQSVDVLWQDYLQKLQEQVQDPLTKYLAVIPQIKARVSKRGRKLIDYDDARHNLEVQQNAKKKDDAKIAKTQEDLDHAKKIYEELNNELHTELPEFYNSRVTFYGNAFQHLFEAEQVFHQEIGKGAERVAAVGEKLSKDNESFTYTPRKNLRHTMSQGSDEHVPNGHSENGNSGYDSSQPGSPRPANTLEKTPEPESPGPSLAQPPVKADVTVENGEQEADTSKQSVEEELPDYENAVLSPQQAASRQSAEVQEVKVTETATTEQVTIATTSGSETDQSTASTSVAKIDQPVTASENVAKSANENLDNDSKDSETKDIPNADYENVVEAAPLNPDNNKVETTEAKLDSDKTVNETDMEDPCKVESPKEQKEAKVIKVEAEGIRSEPNVSVTSIEKISAEEKNEKLESAEPKEEPKENGVDMDSSMEQEVPDHAPPPPPSSEPPTEIQESPKEEKKEIVGEVHDGEDEADGNRDSLYQVPPPAKPVDKLPQGYIKTVIATHPYKGEDEDELSFEAGDVIYVVEYDDPDDQDEGWLMGIRKRESMKGVFPANFTKPVDGSKEA